jgi:hypothetical protein
MRVRIAALIALVLSLSVVIGIAGWWYVKDHQRISQGSIQATVAARAGASSALCDKKDSNGAHWLCAVRVSGTDERCMKAHVRPWGSVDVINGYLKCKQDPALAAMFVVKPHPKKHHKKKRKQSGSA